MQKRIKKIVAGVMVVSMIFGSTGCMKKKKESKPHVQSTAEVKNGTAQAEGKGSGQSEVPLMVGCDAFQKKFNPFLTGSEGDKQAVALTQVLLLDTDRTGRMVEKGIDGEVQKYNDEEYTYYGVADVKKTYKKKAGYTVYRISLREDLIFSDGEAITIDDVLFTLYALCDSSYRGTYTIGQSPIRGLLNYQTNNAMAEQYTENQVTDYIRKNPPALRTWKKKHVSTEEGYEQGLRREARRLLAASAKKKTPVTQIEGIKRLNDYEMRIYTVGYDENFLENLKIPVCPLHYYGDTVKYAPEQGKFGFTRGDISALQANKSKPLGAGAYRFIKYETGIAYFMANELYYRGCPKITYIYLKDLEVLLGKKGSTASDIAKELEGGTLDIVSCTLSEEDAGKLGQINENDAISGKYIETRLEANGVYSAIGINSKNVCVAGVCDSEASIALRTALATVMSACRSRGLEMAPYHYTMSQSLGLKDAWLSKEQNQDATIIYATAPEDDRILYKQEDASDKKEKAATEAALKWFEKAGYTVEEGKVVKAPEDASLQFQLQMAGGTETPQYVLAKQAATKLQEIGITVRILTVTAEQLHKRLEDLRQGKKVSLELWYTNETLSADANYDERFGYLKDAQIEEKLQEAQEETDAAKRKEIYEQVCAMLEKKVVEVPVYQCQNAWLLSNKRVKLKKMAQDTTMFYGWMREIHSMEMKQEN